MQFVFGKVPEEFVELGEHFDIVDASGKTSNYYFKMELDQDTDGYGDIRITDTANRSVPIDLNSIPELISALSLIQEFLEDQAEFKSFWMERFGLKE